jgi:hypothetical protein
MSHVEMTHTGKESSSQHRLGKCVSGDAKVLPIEKKSKKHGDNNNQLIRQLNREEQENLKSFREDRKKDRTYIKFDDGEQECSSLTPQKKLNENLAKYTRTSAHGNGQL